MFLTFFRMKLGSEDVLFRNDSSKLPAIITSARNIFIALTDEMITVHKVKIRSARNTVKDRVFTMKTHGIPTHMRNFQFLMRRKIESHYFSGNKPKPTPPTKFIASIR